MTLTRQNVPIVLPSSTVAAVGVGVVAESQPESNTQRNSGARKKSYP
jgi:hypothetical protein